MLFYNPKLKSRSRELRKNETDAELLIWSKIRRKQIKNRQFYRQRIIGNYIVDFYCPSAKLIIELDGGGHFTDEGIKKDQKRDEYLKDLGFRVIRFSDTDVMKNLDDVLEEIYRNT